MTVQKDSLTVSLANRQTEYLNRLATELEGRGLKVRLLTSGDRPPTLHVLNPGSRALTEDIRVEFSLDGWSFFWSWAEPICSAEDVQGAADAVVRVLYI